MRVLFTGSSSFTGAWFVRALVEAGHEVLASFRGRGPWGGMRALRVAAVEDLCETRYGLAFGDDAFVDLLRSAGPFDVLCHHGAQVGDYRDPGYDPFAAAAANCRNVRAVLAALSASGGTRVVLTGSVFERGEGAGEAPLRPFSPYGLAKSWTADAFAFHAAETGVGLDKFVIANPFGPLEEPRFTRHLLSGWLAGETPHVSHPHYVRDNIPVDLLARAYAGFVGTAAGAGAPAGSGAAAARGTVPKRGLATANCAAGSRRTAPSLFAEPVEAFVARLAAAMRPRLDRPCRFTRAARHAFAEPRVRINTDAADPVAFTWSAEAFWDDYADFARAHYAPPEPRASAAVRPETVSA